MFTAERYLGAGSALASAHPAFRVRPGQMALADAVARAFAGDGHLVAEAGTGVGKSLAYLIPAAFAGRRVVVSTATRALQDQLRSCDLPLARAGDGPPADRGGGQGARQLPVPGAGRRRPAAASTSGCTTASRASASGC